MMMMVMGWDFEGDDGDVHNNDGGDDVMLLLQLMMMVVIIMVLLRMMIMIMITTIGTYINNYKKANGDDVGNK